MEFVKLKNGQEVILRAAMDFDAENIINFKKENATTFNKLLPLNNQETLDLSQEKKWINEYLGSEDALIILAELDSEIIGLLDFSVKTINANWGEFGIFIAPTLQNLGLGTHLFKYLKNWLRNNQNIKWVNLHVLELNIQAIKLYQKLGFQEQSRTLCKTIKNEDAYLIKMYLEI